MKSLPMIYKEMFMDSEGNLITFGEVVQELQERKTPHRYIDGWIQGLEFRGNKHEATKV